MILEICAQSITSAQTAEKAGAHRIELCQALEIGGITPSLGTLEIVRAKIKIPVFVLIRPRAGDFVYSEAELDVMHRDILLCKKLGFEGIVIGSGTADNQLNINQMQNFLSLAKSLEVVCHRVFDRIADPFFGLEKLIEMGYSRVLTSGQGASVTEGVGVLKKLVEQAAGRIEIMAGGGVLPENIAHIAHETGVQSFHFSAKKFQNAGGISWLGTDENLVRETLAVLKKCADDIK